MSKPNDTLTLPPISPSFSEITDWNQVLTINDVQTTSSRIKALEDAVKQLQQRNTTLRKKLGKIGEAIHSIEEWRDEFVEWAEALMAMLWGRPEQHGAARVNSLQGWMEESPV